MEKCSLTIPVGLFAAVLKGDKRDKLELYGDGGQRLYQELAVFFCVQRLKECFSEEVIHTHTFSYTAVWLMCYLGFCRGEGHGPPTLFKKADATSVWPVRGVLCLEA